MNTPIPANTARHVLWMFGADGGLEPGLFTHQLLRLIGYADHQNKAKLASLYPAEAQAVQMAQLDPEGIKTLQGIAADGPSIYCTRCWNADGPFTDAGLCEGCARPMPLGGVM
ncbi:hypothetical protein [Streptomyces sp. 4R-3d]|uniref:hypothetical protein n=1 Tax=Streptomyces sp. 4R-3d TaxID=2559605 RepID=UPI0014312968|nr:hypothetical protein [Streptomyces sp. 4R-3d]